MCSLCETRPSSSMLRIRLQFEYYAKAVVVHFRCRPLRVIKGKRKAAEPFPSSCIRSTKIVDIIWFSVNCVVAIALFILSGGCTVWHFSKSVHHFFNQTGIGAIFWKRASATADGDCVGHGPLLGYGLLDNCIGRLHANFQVSATLSKKVLIFLPY